MAKGEGVDVRLPLTAGYRAGVALTARALLADVALVLLFVVIGRRSHDESAAVVGLARTAWPFLAGLAVGWLAVGTRHRPLRVAPEGVVVWLSTVAIGMLLRVFSGQGTEFSFVVVTLIVLGLFLLGWRALLPVVRRLVPRGPAR